MRILCFDTTTRDLVVALAREGESVAGEIRPDCLKGHSEILLPTVDRLLDQAGLRLADLDAIAACTGPGSFTGIRIGLVTARTFCQATGLPLLPVNSLEYRAYHVPSQKKCVALDAMQNKVYYALYEGDREISAPAFCEKQALAAKLPADTRVFADLDLPGCAREAFSALPERLAEFALDHRSRAGNFAEVVPLYLRKCQAEESLAEKEK